MKRHLNSILKNSALFYSLFFLLSSQSSQAQELQNGLILPKAENTKVTCCIFVPQQGFTVYNEPNGISRGKITGRIPNNANAKEIFNIYFIANGNQNPLPIATNYLQEVDYETWALTYVERKNGFVRVLNKETAYWLSEVEIAEQGFKITEWQQFLMEKSGSVLGYYAKKPGLNIRTAPMVAKNKIMTLYGDLHEITLTDEYKGLWNKVTVIIRKEHPCNSSLPEEENITEELEGWVKLIDDSGTPNVWFYVRGC